MVNQNHLPLKAHNDGISEEETVKIPTVDSVLRVVAVTITTVITTLTLATVKILTITVIGTIAITGTVLATTTTSVIGLNEAIVP